MPDIAHAAARFLDERGVEKVTLVGNSMGCPVICEFAYLYPERLDRAVLVSPAGGLHNQPLRRAVNQLAHDGIREPTRMVKVALPDYVRFGMPSTFRMFRALTQYPSLQRLLDLKVPTLVVIGDRDPLMPSPARVQEVASQTDSHVLIVVIEGAAHAINFSHPGELAHVIRLFMADKPIVDDPDSPGHSRAYEIHRGTTIQRPRTLVSGIRPRTSLAVDDDGDAEQHGEDAQSEAHAGGDDGAGSGLLLSRLDGVTATTTVRLVLRRGRRGRTARAAPRRAGCRRPRPAPGLGERE